MSSISIIVPAYNAERFLANTIDSVRNQMFADWEMIIVVDGRCADGTREVAESAASDDSRIRVLANGTHGVVANRNLGIEHAKAHYLAFLDSDDWWHPRKLEEHLAFMRDRHAALSCTGYYRVSEDGKSIRRVIQVPSSISYGDLLHENSIGCLTAIIDRRVFPYCEFHNLDHEDYALWLRLLRGGGTAYGLNKPLAFYREVAGSLSSKKLRTIAWRWRIFRKQEKLSMVKSAYYAGAGSWIAMLRRIPMVAAFT